MCLVGSVLEPWKLRMNCLAKAMLPGANVGHGLPNFGTPFKHSYMRRVQTVRVRQAAGKLSGLQSTGNQAWRMQHGKGKHTRFEAGV